MPTRPTAFVRNRHEAEAALSAGAAVVFLVPPDGASRTEVANFLRSMIDGVAGRAMTGALVPPHPDPDMVARLAEEFDAMGLQHLLVETGPAEDHDRIADRLGTLNLRAAVTALIRAAAPDLLPYARNRFQGVILTPGSQSGRLLDERSVAEIARFVESAHAAGLEAGLCGRLETPDVPRLAPIRPDFLVFGDDRPADRTSLAEAADMLRSLLPRSPETAAPETAAPLGTYTLFVRELVLPVEIGAYSFEHGRTQKVRFDVEAEVERTTLEPRTMADVFSYDVIMDAIRASVEGGHVQLSETLAEVVAASVVAHPLVVRVRVRVEKLELGPAGIGVEVEHLANRRL